MDKPDDQVKGRTDGLDFCIERECTRRCFWLIQCMSWISGIYIYKPMRPRSLELTKKIRLPIDETTFDLAAHWSSASESRLRLLRRAPLLTWCMQLSSTCMHLLRRPDTPRSLATFCASYPYIKQYRMSSVCIYRPTALNAADGGFRCS